MLQLTESKYCTQNSRYLLLAVVIRCILCQLGPFCCTCPSHICFSDIPQHTIYLQHYFLQMTLSINFRTINDPSDSTLLQDINSLFGWTV